MPVEIRRDAGKVQLLDAANILHRHKLTIAASPELLQQLRVSHRLRLVDNALTRRPLQYIRPPTDLLDDAVLDVFQIRHLGLRVVATRTMVELDRDKRKSILDQEALRRYPILQVQHRLSELAGLVLFKDQLANRVNHLRKTHLDKRMLPLEYRLLDIIGKHDQLAIDPIVDAVHQYKVAVIDAILERRHLFRIGLGAHHLAKGQLVIIAYRRRLELLLILDFGIVLKKP